MCLKSQGVTLIVITPRIKIILSDIVHCVRQGAADNKLSHECDAYIIALCGVSDWDWMTVGLETTE